MTTNTNTARFRDLLDEALATPIEGWHFSFLQGRVQGTELPWSYADLAQPLVATSQHLLDVDTGGGEGLSRLNPPAGSIAVEDWAPNIPIASTNLAPLDVAVRSRVDRRLPANDAEFDLVLNRHGDLDLAESVRVLLPGGVLLTQQVGHDNEIEFSRWFGGTAKGVRNAVTSLASLRSRTERAGLLPEIVGHSVTTTRYLDVGAVVLQLRAVPWQVPDFDVALHLEVLEEIHRHIQTTGALTVHSTRYLLRANKPTRK